MSHTTTPSLSLSLRKRASEDAREERKKEVENAKGIYTALKQAQYELSKAQDLYYTYQYRKFTAGFMSAADVGKEFERAKENTDSLIEKLFEGEGRTEPNPLLEWVEDHSEVS